MAETPPRASRSSKDNEGHKSTSKVTSSKNGVNSTSGKRHGSETLPNDVNSEVPTTKRVKFAEPGEPVRARAPHTPPPPRVAQPQSIGISPVKFSVGPNGQNREVYFDRSEPLVSEERRLEDLASFDASQFSSVWGLLQQTNESSISSEQEEEVSNTKSAISLSKLLTIPHRHSSSRQSFPTVLHGTPSASPVADNFPLIMPHPEVQNLLAKLSNIDASTSPSRDLPQHESFEFDDDTPSYEAPATPKPHTTPHASSSVQTPVSTSKPSAPLNSAHIIVNSAPKNKPPIIVVSSQSKQAFNRTSIVSAPSKPKQPTVVPVAKATSTVNPSKQTKPVVIAFTPKPLAQNLDPTPRRSNTLDHSTFSSSQSSQPNELSRRASESSIVTSSQPAAKKALASEMLDWLQDAGFSYDDFVADNHLPSSSLGRSAPVLQTTSKKAFFDSQGGSSVSSAPASRPGTFQSDSIHSVGAELHSDALEMVNDKTSPQGLGAEDDGPSSTPPISSLNEIANDEDDIFSAYSQMFDGVDFDEFDLLGPLGPVDEEEEEIALTTSRFRRYLVLEVSSESSTEVVLRALDEANGSEHFLCLRDEWSRSDIRVGDSINMVGKAEPKGAPYTYIVDSQKNLVILHPDVLVSGTMLSQTSDCTRRAIINHTIKTQPRFDLDAATKSVFDSQQGSTPAGPASSLMSQSPTTTSATPPRRSIAQSMFDPKLALYGIFAHELFQEAIAHMNFTLPFLHATVDKIIADHIINIFAIGDSEEPIRQVLKGWIPSIIGWADKYIPGAQTDARNGLKAHPNQHWKYKTSLNGDIIEIEDMKFTMQIERALDIEEHVASVMYGLKGDIDVSLLIRITPISTKPRTSVSFRPVPSLAPNAPEFGKSLMVPLEIKSGSLSTSYASQVILYSLLMADRYNRDIPTALLFSIKECNTVVLEISRRQVSYAINHRNTVASFVHRPQLLPPLIKRAEMCSGCYQVDSCMILNAAFEHGVASESGIAVDLFQNIVSNISSPKHAEFLSQWFHLVDTEANEIMRYRKQIWSMPQAEREKQGRCLGGMRLVSISSKRPDRSENDSQLPLPSSHRSSQSTSTVKDSQKMVSTGKRQLFLTFERWPLSIGSSNAHSSRLHTPQKSQKVSKQLDTVYLDTSLDKSFTDCTPTARHFLMTDLQFSVGDHIVLSEGRHLAVANCSVVEITPHSITLVCNRSTLRPPPKETSHALPLSQRFTPLKNKLARLQSPKKDIPDIESIGVTCMPQVPSSSQTDSQIADLQIRRLGSSVRWRLDRDEVQSGFNALKGNLIQLFQSTLWAKKFRPLFVDRMAPKFIETPLTQDEEDFLNGRKNSLISPDASIQSHHALNSDQIGAIRKSLNARDYAIILGMPGTGKTATISALVSLLVNRGKSVLIAAGTHSAVDNLLLHCKRNGVSFLRLGQPELVHPDIRSSTLILESQNLKTVEALNKALGPDSPQARVIGTTCMSANHPLFQTRFFDYCIVDEASQITLPVVLGPLRLANKCILIGDLYQLPPVIKSPHARPLADSLFKLLAEAHPSAIHKLRIQYRMNDDIMSLSNRLIYQNQLISGSEKVSQQRIQFEGEQEAFYKKFIFDLDQKSDWMKQVLDPQRSVVFLNTDLVPALEEKVELKDVVRNPTEAMIVAQITSCLIHVGLQREQIGIISPLRAQLKQIRASLTHLGLLTASSAPSSSQWLEVHTVDKYQGSDRDVIIISLVRSNPARNVGSLLKDWRRINVAFTRAKKKLIIIGSRSTLSSNHLLSAFFNMIDEKGWNLQLPKDAHTAKFFYDSDL